MYVVEEIEPCVGQDARIRRTESIDPRIEAIQNTVNTTEDAGNTNKTQLNAMDRLLISKPVASMWCSALLVGPGGTP